MAEFTPGPWHWTLNVTMHETRIEAPSGTIIAQKWRRSGAGRGTKTHWHVPTPDSIHVADVRLIAAAPDLYEVVRKLVHHESPPDMLWERARIALAKVQGNAAPAAPKSTP